MCHRSRHCLPAQRPTPTHNNQTNTSDHSGKQRIHERHHDCNHNHNLWGRHLRCVESQHPRKIVNLPMRPGKWEAMMDHFLGPKSFTNALTLASSDGVHGPCTTTTFHPEQNIYFLIFKNAGPEDKNIKIKTKKREPRLDTSVPTTTTPLEPQQFTTRVP